MLALRHRPLVQSTVHSLAGETDVSSFQFPKLGAPGAVVDTGTQRKDTVPAL